MNADVTNRREELAALIGCRAPASVVARQWRELDSPTDRARLWRLELATEAGYSIPCLMFIPQTEGEARAVIAVHQHNNEYRYGKSEPAGLVGNPHAAYALHLAAEGFIVLIPDLEGFEDRRWIHDVDGEFLAAMAAVTEGGSLHGRYVNDIMTASAYLQDRDDVTGDLGIIGHSLGGQVALLSLALDHRLAWGVISSGLTTLKACRESQVRHNPGWYVPGLVAFGDYGAVARLCVGKRVLAVAADADAYFPAVGAKEVFDQFPESTAQIVWRSGGHDLTQESFEVLLQETLRVIG